MIAPVTFANRYDHFPSGARVGADARGVRANAANAESGPATGGLSPQARQKVAELQRRDREVRAHELAHVAAGAGLIARGANFTYVTGPDGQRYAVAGDVRIDTSPGRTPEETLRRAEQVRAAALAPADPSPQDYAVAAEAARMAAEARQAMAAERRQEQTTEVSGSAPLTAAADKANQAARFAPAALRPQTIGRLIDLFA